MPHFDLIAFDADDTLWHTERLYIAAQEQFKALLAHYHSAEWIEQRLYQTELRNLEHFGYGTKAFALSLIETAIELTEGRVQASEIATLIELAKTMLTAEIELLEHAGATLAALAGAQRLMLLTKGDLFDQERKLARSGLSEYFQHVEVVSAKTPASYAALLQRHNLAPERFLMVGNSLRSDILPVLAVGGWAVYVPYPLTWAHEHAEIPAGHARFFEIEHLGLLDELLQRIASL